MAKFPSDPFHSPKLLLKGALGDIRRLEAEWLEFHARCFGLPFEEVDKVSGETVIKFRLLPKISDDFRVFVSNPLNNLRHVLDQAVNSASVHLGGKSNNQFPFARDALHLEDVIKKNCPTVPLEILNAIRRYHPYGGGDNVLYSLARISRLNKHRAILSIDAKLMKLVMFGPGGYFHSLKTGIGGAKLGLLAWDSEKQEVEVARGAAGLQFVFAPIVKPAIFVAIADDGMTTTEPASTFLRFLAEKVDRILHEIETETLRTKIP